MARPRPERSHPLYVYIFWTVAVLYVLGVGSLAVFG